MSKCAWDRGCPQPAPYVRRCTPPRATLSLAPSPKPKASGKPTQALAQSVAPNLPDEPDAARTPPAPRHRCPFRARNPEPQPPGQGTVRRPPPPRGRCSPRSLRLLPRETLISVSVWRGRESREAYENSGEKVGHVAAGRLREVGVKVGHFCPSGIREGGGILTVELYRQVRLAYFMRGMSSV